MSLRRRFAALAAGVVVVGLLVWQPWTGQLEGTVYFTGCGGAELAGSSGYRNCTTTVAAGAEVVASPANGGASTEAVADSKGYYNLRLMPGRYYLWGDTTTPIRDRGDRLLVQVSAGAVAHVDVGVLFSAP